MKKALAFLALLAAALLVALAVRVRQIRSAGRGAPGGTGVVEGLDVNVTSRLATRIEKVAVREGDVVSQGQPLVELDCTTSRAALEHARAELAATTAALQASHADVASATHTTSAAVGTLDAARAQIDALEAQERMAKIDLERTRRLVAVGGLPESDLDSATARDDTLVAQIAAQRAATSAAGNQVGVASGTRQAAVAQTVAAQDQIDAAEAAVREADDSVRECTLFAPRAGIVATRVREPGEAVLPGTVVLTITDLSDARTRFYIPNADLAAAAPGRTVHVVADAYPGRVFDGTIYYVSPRAEFTPRNVQTREDRERLVYAVEVRIENADMTLRAGMPVEVTIAPPSPAAAAPAVGMR